MQKKILFIFHDFDPINENLLNLIDHVSEELYIKQVMFVYDNSFEKPSIFSQKEKVILINAATEHRSKCQYIIDGESFSRKSEYFLDKIVNIRNEYSKEDICWLITSKQYKNFKDSDDFKLAASTVDIVVYTFDEDKDELEHMWNLKISHVNSNQSIKGIDDTIYDVGNGNFAPLVVSYINASTECAIKRIKSLQERSRFEHSMRVAGTIAEMCILTKETDEEFKYKCYIAAIYHDICKNLPAKEQITIAKEKLNIVEFSNYKILHGPVGKWYMENKYLYEDQEVLEAIKQHTIPLENPSKLTKYLYLADKLELQKKPDFEEEEYEEYWKLISENKIDEAFKKLTSKCGVDSKNIIYAS